MITLSQMVSTLGNCFEDQPSLRNPGTSQYCESFSAERRGSTQKEKKEVSHYHMTSWHFKRKQIGKETLIIAQKIPSRQREWNSMKNLALLAVFTMASIASSSMLALSEPNSTFADMGQRGLSDGYDTKRSTKQYDSWLYIVYVGLVHPKIKMISPSCHLKPKDFCLSLKYKWRHFQLNLKGFCSVWKVHQRLQRNPYKSKHLLKGFWKDTIIFAN